MTIKNLLRALILFMVLIVIGSLLIFPSSCGQSTQVDTTPSYDSYFPLQSGRIITYEVFTTLYTFDMTSFETTSTLETWQFDGSVPIAGTTLEALKVQVISGGTITSYYFREDSTGLYEYGSGDSPISETWLRYPLTVGATWEGRGLLYNSVVTEETVTTRAGSFLCKKIEYGAPSIVNDWYAKEIGLIKTKIISDTIPPEIISREVISRNF